MSDIVYVFSDRLKKVFRADKNNIQLKAGDICLIESSLGGELAMVVDTPQKIRGNRKAEKGAVKVIRKATEKDKDKFAWMRKKEKEAFDFCLQRIKERKLPMKMVRVRYFFNEKKGIFYYTAEGRIDFRALVKDLAKRFRMRIEMRQIGVRDEAKMIGGIGVCGRELCCASFMKTFEPVSIQKAKKQNITINPTKISGICGRLMCCLAFEAESKGRLYTEEEPLLEED
ncbi:MAG: PSP1 domain-containing protein [Acidobacteriota bacterium]